MYCVDRLKPQLQAVINLNQSGVRYDVQYSKRRDSVRNLITTLRQNYGEVQNTPELHYLNRLKIYL